MSTLVVQIPSRLRLRSSAGGAEPGASGPTTEYPYVTSPDGLALEAQGRCAAALFPKATTVIAVLADTDVSWHRITLPKAPGARLRAALGGVLEEALLEDDDDVHLALAPSAIPGQPTWVAAVSRRWLRAELAALEKADVFVDRVVPMTWPDDPPIGHFSETAVDPGSAAHGIALHWAHADGVATVRLQGGLARALVPTPPPPDARWSATPGAVAAAEQWLGAPVRVMPPGQRLLQAGRSLWNLRQFDLARRHRGVRAVRDSARRFFSPEWRPVRFGLAAFVIAQVVGLNLWAWHQRSEIDARQATMQGIVTSTFPNANPQDVQRDADAVMQREAQALRSAAGKPGESDLESLLQAAASAWPAERAAVETIRFEPGRLTLSAVGWSDAQIAQFRSLLRPNGWAVETVEGRLVVSRARPGATS
ncbi:MAG TPA: type II secretion system protein GspL [Burkholderiaceae bacterium]|nr:type II secretion system protein GspL [Burkholderiaceae bacterium]